MAGSAVIGALRVNLGIDTAAFSTGLKGAQSKLSGFGRAAAKGLAVAGAAAVAAAGGVALAVKGILNDADDMAKASQKIGVPIDQLSRLRHAANLSGVEFGSLQNGMKRFSANIYDASQGIGEGAKAFEALGISVTDSQGNLRSTTDLMAEVSDVFATLPDGAEKTALAMKLFGKAGADMIPMLNGGKTALQGLFAEADKLGIVFDEKTGKAAEQFNDNLSRLGTIVQSIGMQIAADLAPHLAAFTDWMVQNAPAIREQLVGALNAVVNAVRWLSGAVGEVTAAWQAFDAMWTQTGEKIRAFAASIPEYFANVAAQMQEIGAQIVDGLWNGLKSRFDAVTSWVSNAASGIAERFRSVLRIQSPSRVMMEIGGHIMAGLRGGMETGMQGVTEIAETAAGGITDAFNGIGESIGQAIAGTKTWADVARDAIKSIANQLIQSGLNALGNTGFGGFLGSIFRGIFGGFRANGGPVTAGRSYVVGERGPELFTPGSSGQIVPNHAMGGGIMAVQVGVSVDDEGAIKAYVKKQTMASEQRARSGAVNDAKSSFGTWAQQNQKYGRPA